MAWKLWLCDALVVGLLLARLAQTDASGLFSPRPEAETERVLEDLALLRARLDNFYDEAAAGSITAHALGRIEGKFLVDIERLERRLRSREAPPVLYDLAKAPAEVWERLSVPQRREVIRTLLDVTIHQTKPGRRVFEPPSGSGAWRGARPAAATASRWPPSSR